jgi:DNA topoisomerase-1
MSKNLVIVESPAKAKTIENYLGKDFIVKSSFGHVRDLSKKGISIDVANDFLPKYEVSADKKTVVAELKKLVKNAETVWLATDEDREGEAISWHLYETLNLEKKDTKRITFNEITKPAILKAIESPRDINIELVNAQQARRVLDRLVGFELSPVLWRKVKPSLSAGRVQSVAVRLIVEREREIERFNSDSFYKVQGVFTKGKDKFKTEYSSVFKTADEVEALLKSCINASFLVSEVTQKPAVRQPSSPFTTSTLQQEASLKLGFSVSRTMTVAQRLYEDGKITYMRTDSVNLSETAIDAAKREIVDSYGKEYSNPTKYTTKSASAQEAHEAIRPTDFANHKISGASDEVKLYDLIWKRAIASQMSHAQLERTTIKINTEEIQGEFVAKGEVIKFDGFLKVYLESSVEETDEETETTESGILPKVAVGESLSREEIIATQRFSRPPARYVEASLVKKLEELGIGRPSTYAPTISTIQKRGYVERKELEGVERKYDFITLVKNEVSKTVKSEIIGREKNKLFPTDIGTIVNDFLVEHFEKILDYNFTAAVEKQFDDIANGLTEWTKMIKDFYNPFHENVENTIENSDKVNGARELGVHPESGKKVVVKIGRFGPLVQIGGETEDDKPQFASLRKDQSINTITMDDALELFKLPRTLGEHEGAVVKSNIGRFGPYVQVGKEFVSIPKGGDPMTITLEEAIQLYINKQQAAANNLIKEFDQDKSIQILNGRYGPYIKKGKNNYKIPAKTEPSELTFEQVMEIIEKEDASPKVKRKKK